MPSIGARALGAQLEQRVEGSTSQDSIDWIVSSLSPASTVGSGERVRLGARVMGSGLGARGSGVRLLP